MRAIDRLVIVFALTVAPLAASLAQPKPDHKGETGKVNGKEPGKDSGKEDPKPADPRPAEGAAEETAQPAAEAGAGAPAGDLAALRKEYEALRESLFTSRSRAAAVGDALYSAKLQVLLRFAAGRFHTIRRATIRLDGANVYDDTTGAVVGDEAPRFEGFVAPGTHVVTIRLEAQAKDDDRFVTTTEESFTIDAPTSRLVIVRARASDEGDMAFAWRKKQRGSYKLRLDVDVEARPRERAGKDVARTGARR
jgi:hypothetical protein